MSRTREDNDNHNLQQKNNKFFKHQFNRNQQFDKFQYFNNFKKNDKSENHIDAQKQNKRTYTKIKNEKNNYCFKCHKSDHFHRNYFERNK